MGAGREEEWFERNGRNAESGKQVKRDWEPANGRFLDSYIIP